MARVLRLKIEDKKNIMFATVLNTSCCVLALADTCSLTRTFADIYLMPRTFAECLSSFAECLSFRLLNTPKYQYLKRLTPSVPLIG